MYLAEIAGFSWGIFFLYKAIFLELDVNKSFVNLSWKQIDKHNLVDNFMAYTNNIFTDEDSQMMCDCYC